MINQPPVAFIVVFPGSIPEDDDHTTIVSADATPSWDRDDDPLSFVWDVPDGIYLNSTDQADRTIQVTFPGSHPHTIRLTVDDGHGASAKDSVIVIIL